MFCYRWQEAEDENLLNSDETITDYTYISEDHFLLLVLLTSRGDLRIYYDVPGTGPQYRSISIRDIAPVWCHAAALCLIPDASGIAFILTNGNVLLIPLRVLVDIPWGQGGILHSDSFTLIEVEVKNQQCLRQPTSALCYTSLHSKRPILIYSNKAGQIFIIDLTLRKVSVGLGAPESIHKIEVFATDFTIRLLVTSFTGAQWLLPLEEEGLSLRETLGRVVPSELKQIHKVPAKLSVTQDGKLCLLEIEKNRLQLFGDVSFNKPICDVNVPKNSWLVHWTENVTFVVCNQTTTMVCVHLGLVSSFSDLIYENLEKSLPARTILGIVPAGKKGLFPSCIIVTDKGSVFVHPQGTLDDRLVGLVAQHHYALDFCDRLALRLGRPQLEFYTRLLRQSLTCFSASTLSLESLDEITRFAVEAPGLEIVVTIRIFTEFGVADSLLPSVLGRCDENGQDACRHFVIPLFIAKFKKYPAEKDNIEFQLRNFLLKHADVSNGLEELLTCGFWTCVSVVVKREERNSESIAKFLAESKAIWPTHCVSDFVKILSSLQWSRLPRYTESLLRRMTGFLFNLKSSTHIFMFAKIAEDLIQRFAPAATILFVLSSLRLLAASSSIRSDVLLSSTSLSCGSNCVAVVSEEESPVLWGEFSPGTRKAKDDDKPNVSHSERAAMLTDVLVPDRVCSVSCGTEHVLILTFQGKLFSFGKNRYGQCGVGHRNELKEPTAVPHAFEGLRCMKAGHYHSSVVDAVGRVYTWGWGRHGQLAHDGVHRTEDVLTPKLVETINEPVVAVACGYAHSVFLTESGTVLTCGNGNYGQLGSGQIEKKRFVPEAVVLPEAVELISSKYFHCLVLTRSKKLYQWGLNPQALKMKIFLRKRLRSNKSSSASSSTSSVTERSLESSQTHLHVSQIFHSVEEKIVLLDAGYSHSALLTETGLLYTWGKGIEMQLGHGNKKEQEEPHRLFEPADVIWKDACCGLDFTAALASDGSVYVWGRNDKGQLGVTSDPSPQQTRKIILKTQKGPKTVQFSGGLSCVSTPHKLSSVTSSFASETALSELNVRRLIEILKGLDNETAREISSCLLRDPVNCLASVFVHLLAGDSHNAVDVFVRLFDGDTDAPVNAPAYTPDNTILDVMWDFIMRHPNFTTQWHLLRVLLSKFSLGERLLSNPKLSLQAPSIFVANADVFDGLSADEKLRLIEKWQPCQNPDFVQVPQRDLQVPSKVGQQSACLDVLRESGEMCSLVEGKRFLRETAYLPDLFGELEN